MGVLALGAWYERKNLVIQNNGTSESHNKNMLSYLVLLFIWFGVCYYFDALQIAAIPPVIVVGMENSQKIKIELPIVATQIFFLVLSAFFGSLIHYYIENQLLQCCLILFSISLLNKFIGIKLPPAYAMALLPMVLPMVPPFYFTINVMMASIGLLGGIYLYKLKVIPFLKRNN